MKQFSLFKRFTVLSLAAFVIMGLVLGVIISNHVKTQILDSIQDSTVSLFDTIIKPVLVPAEFDKTQPIKISPELNSKVEELKDLAALHDITIWNREGDVLYSNNSPVELKTVNDFLLNSALANNVRLTLTSISSKGGDVTDSSGKMIKIYAPIVFDNQIVGAFAVDKSYREVEIHLVELNKILIAVIFAGLLILYLFLLKTVSNASRQLVEQNKSLQEREKELQESYGKLNANYKSTVLTLSKAVDARDSYTAGHSERVAKLAVAIGQRMGLTAGELETLELAALFHDIGKLGVPDSILNKAGRLTDAEYEKVKEHPAAGVEIIQSIDFLKDTLDIIKHHHERFAGGGYPDGIQGEDIPLSSRIIAIADTYDAITSDRPYRKGLSHQESVDELIRFKQKQFDPAIVDVFLGIQRPDYVTGELELEAI